MLHLFLREVIILGYRDRNEGHILAANYPEIAKQWNYDKNGALTPWDVTIGSSRKVWWKCSLGHEWEAVVGDRARNNSGCPYCANRKAWPGFTGKYRHGLLKLYAQHAVSAMKGAYME